MNDAVEYIIGCIRDIGLEVSSSKTASLVFGTARRDVPIRIGDVMIDPSPSIKYLGVMLDCKLSFVQHVRYATEKASKVSRALERLMPNLRGSCESKRRLYSHVVDSILLYAAPV